MGTDIYRRMVTERAREQRSLTHQLGSRTSSRPARHSVDLAGELMHPRRTGRTGARWVKICRRSAQDPFLLPCLGSLPATSLLGRPTCYFPAQEAYLLLPCSGGLLASNACTHGGQQYLNEWDMGDPWGDDG